MGWLSLSSGVPSSCTRGIAPMSSIFEVFHRTVGCGGKLPFESAVFCGLYVFGRFLQLFVFRARRRREFWRISVGEYAR